MSRLQVGVIRYASVVQAISRQLGVDIVPDIRIGRGRIYLTFRNVGATRWTVDQQSDHALHVAGVARAVLEADDRRLVRRLKRRAVVVIYEDISLVRGCEATARWECVVPVPRSW